MSKKEFTFDPAKQKLVATRDFTRGQLAGSQGKPIDTAGLDLPAIRHLVQKAGVAKVEPKGKKPTTKKPAQKPATKPKTAGKSATAEAAAKGKSENA